MANYRLLRTSFTFTCRAPWGPERPGQCHGVSTHARTHAIKLSFRHQYPRRSEGKFYMTDLSGWGLNPPSGVSLICHLYLSNIEAQRGHANVISAKYTHLLTVFSQKNEENNVELLLKFWFHVGMDRAKCKTTLKLILAGSLRSGNVSANYSSSSWIHSKSSHGLQPSGISLYAFLCITYNCMLWN